MQARQFEQFLQDLSSLTRRQRDRLLALLLDGQRIASPEVFLRAALGRFNT